MCLRAEINSQIQENVKVNMKIHNTSTAPLIFTNPNLLFSFFSASLHVLSARLCINTCY